VISAHLFCNRDRDDTILASAYCAVSETVATSCAGDEARHLIVLHERHIDVDSESVQISMNQVQDEHCKVFTWHPRPGVDVRYF
jgi:hypothetical protein